MTNNNLSNISFLIPSLDPDINMVNYINELVSNGLENIIIVDDGSKQDNQHFFDEISKHSQVTVLHHEVNKGKGRALKTGIEYIVSNLPNVVGIVTADADGQHSCIDTINVAKRLLDTNCIVFGTRNFDEENVPFKSRNGNKITTAVFKFLYRKTIHDTQTGLRGLPIDFAKECLDIKGERFEYEIAMLIKAVMDNREIIEEPIETIYIDSNRATHFNTFKDSFKIYSIILREIITYSASSLLSSIIDLIIYTTLINTVFNDERYISGIMWATIIARVISSIVNYGFNKKTVFKNDTKTSETLLKYYVVVALQMLASGFLTMFLFSKLRINTTIIKILVDLFLFTIGYQVQKGWVFK